MPVMRPNEGLLERMLRWEARLGYPLSRAVNDISTRARPRKIGWHIVELCGRLEGHVVVLP
ncbi:hypothetical protein DPMN_092563 [Dreissena polymorpha]|uniref:Uncharacterized protein n=1 Tax=Dreissena polymorpha TaxID=45954 RepID=A0A9D4R141_DREPO|nr:hypothetical protein DPMN_092563 [Dreissena polymorpha]